MRNTQRETMSQRWCREFGTAQLCACGVVYGFGGWDALVIVRLQRTFDDQVLETRVCAYCGCHISRKCKP